MHPQNVTLDCRLVDFDSAGNMKDILKEEKIEDPAITAQKLYAREKYDGTNVIGALSLAFPLIPDSNQFIVDKIYQNSYKEELKK